MKQVFSTLFLAISFLLAAIPAVAANTSDALASFSTNLKGRVLAVDMDTNDNIARSTIISGKDLILVRVIPVMPKKPGDALQLQLVAISKPEELLDIDYDHDGVIEKKEMVKANISFLRYNSNDEIVIDRLAGTFIKAINYHKNQDGTYTITLISNDNMKFNGYFIDL